MPRAGCYVHLPFCDRICPYCDFAVVEFATLKAARYIAALEREIASEPPPAAHVDTIYLGGGTPSALAAADVARVLASLHAKFSATPGSIECTLEANPARNVSDLDAWRAAGVTRLSVGVQSLDARELHRLGRTHTAAEALEFISAARAAGFDNVSADLIAGAPGQTLASFEGSLRSLAAADVDHVSIYGLTIEEGTPYAAWHAREPSAFPDDDAVADLLACADDVLAGAGYRHYEISNFARPGRECAHNIGYWRQDDCVAFGMSASGYRAGERFTNVRSYDEYCSAIESGRSARAVSERLDFPRRVGEAAMLALRTADGIDDDDFRRRFGIDAKAVFAAARKNCAAAGLLEIDRAGARLTPRGRLLANEVCAQFLEPSL